MSKWLITRVNAWTSCFHLQQPSEERRFKESALSHSEEDTGMNHIQLGGLDRQEIYHAAKPFFFFFFTEEINNDI